MAQRMTQERASNRVENAGYKLLSKWVSFNKKITVYCERHGKSQDIDPQNLIYKGHKPVCCWREANSLNRIGKPSGKMLKQANVSAVFEDAGFELRSEYAGYDKRVNAYCKKHKKEGTVLPKTIFSGGGLACCRSQKVSEANSFNMLNLHAKNFEYCVNKAKTSRGQGKVGTFYIAGIHGKLKFGGTTIKISDRISILKKRHGEATLLMAVTVDNVHAYEAAMMMKYREYWAHGEFFRDFRSQITTPENPS